MMTVHWISKKYKWIGAIAALTLCCAIPATAQLPATIDNFLAEHCFDCHDEDVQKGDLDLTALRFDLSDPAHFSRWERVFDRAYLDEMPPKKKERPDRAELRAFLQALKTPLASTDQRKIATEGRVQGRRLTRREYQNTIGDLLGVGIPLDEILTEDPTTHGFETIADGQQLSLHVLARYLDAADIVLNEAFARAFDGDAEYKRQHLPKDLSQQKGYGNFRGPEHLGSQSIFYNINLQFYGRMPVTRVPEDGWYEVTLKSIKAINPPKGQDGVLYARLQSGDGYSDDPLLYEVGIIEATPTPRDVSFQTFIRKDHLLRLKPEDATLKRVTTGASGGNVGYKGRNLIKKGESAIGITAVNLQRIYPKGDHKAVLHGLFADITTPDTFKTSNAKSDKEKADLLTKLMVRFAHRAFRTQVPYETVRPYVHLAKATLKEKNGTMEGALKAGYRAILCSPRFLTLVEKPGALDANAVAARLSYTFWNSTPDWPLRKAALDGSLLDRKVLHAQVDRLLKHPRGQRFIDSFTDQWLTLNSFDDTSPDLRRFRTWDWATRNAMLGETRQYIHHLIEKNLPVETLIDSNFSFLNHRLARHYGMTKHVKITPGGGLQKVTFPKDSARGGLVTQGAILKLTADGTITSPIVRGVWVGERLLGTHIPPPPPNIPAVEPDIRGATSIRDQLDKHRSNESCNACHEKIDPAGFALENYDPVGLWRDFYGKVNKSAKVNPTGVTPEGQAFKNVREWKAIYAKQPDKLAKAFVEHFLTYATGAPPRFGDRDAIAKIVEQTRPEGHGLRALIHAAIKSDVFLWK